MKQSGRKRAPYTSNACYACRAGKRRCSGARPCERCARLGRECASGAPLGTKRPRKTVRQPNAEPEGYGRSQLAGTSTSSRPSGGSDRYSRADSAQYSNSNSLRSLNHMSAESDGTRAAILKRRRIEADSSVLLGFASGVQQAQRQSIVSPASIAGVDAQRGSGSGGSHVALHQQPTSGIQLQVSPATHAQFARMPNTGPVQPGLNMGGMMLQHQGGIQSTGQGIAVLSPATASQPAFGPQRLAPSVGYAVPPTQPAPMYVYMHQNGQLRAPSAPQVVYQVPQHQHPGAGAQPLQPMRISEVSQGAHLLAHGAGGSRAGPAAVGIRLDALGGEGAAQPADVRAALSYGTQPVAFSSPAGQVQLGAASGAGQGRVDAGGFVRERAPLEQRVTAGGQRLAGPDVPAVVPSAIASSGASPVARGPSSPARLAAGRVREQVRDFWRREGERLGREQGSGRGAGKESIIRVLPGECKRLAAAVGKVLESDQALGARGAAGADVLLEEDQWLAGLDLGQGKAASQPSTSETTLAGDRAGSTMSAASLGEGASEGGAAAGERHGADGAASRLAGDSGDTEDGESPIARPSRMRGGAPVTGGSQRATMVILENVALKHLPVPAARMEFTYEPNRPSSLYINDAGAAVLGFGCEELSGCIRQGFLPVAYDPQSWLERGRAVLPAVRDRRSWLVHRSKMRRVVRGDVQRPWEGLLLQYFEMTETLYFEWFDSDQQEGQCTGQKTGGSGQAAGAEPRSGGGCNRFRAAISYFSDIVDLDETLWIQPTKEAWTGRGGAGQAMAPFSSSSSSAASGGRHQYQFPSGEACGMYYVRLNEAHGLGPKLEGVQRTAGGEQVAVGAAGGEAATDGPSSSSSAGEATQLTPSGGIVTVGASPLFHLVSPYHMLEAMGSEALSLPGRSMATGSTITSGGKQH